MSELDILAKNADTSNTDTLKKNPMLNRRHLPKGAKKPRKKVSKSVDSDTLEKENWSNFLTKDLNGGKSSRWITYDELQDIKSDNTNRPIWSEYFSEVMIHLMELSSPIEMANLFALNGLLDVKGYVAVKASLGVCTKDALDQYQELMLLGGDI